MNFDSLVPVLHGALGGAVVSGALAGPFKTLDDIWYAKIGRKYSESARALKILEDESIEKFQKAIVENYQKINLENLQEPRASILLEAMDTSLHYLNEEEIREMFAKLIVSSMDKTKNEISHHAFVQIIKQLSPREAWILSDLNKFGLKTYYPIQRAYFTDEKGKYIEFEHSLIAVFDSSADYKLNGAPITNLQRLGLIEISDNITPNKTELTEATFSFGSNYIKEIYPGGRRGLAFSTKSASIALTPFGINFIMTCL